MVGWSSCQRVEALSIKARLDIHMLQYVQVYNWRMDQHRRTLVELCRVCGERLNKANERQIAYSTSEYATRLDITLNVNVSHDKEDIHPTKFCHKCYRLLTR